MSAGYTNLRTVSYRDTIAELLDRAKQTHTRATGVQVFSPGDGMAYEDSEGFINPISPALFDDAKSQIAEASEALVATEAELEAAQGRIDETAVLLGQLDEQSEATAAEAKAASERVAQAEADLEAAREELRAADAAAAKTLADLDGRLDQNTSELTSLSSTMEGVSQQSSEAKTAADAATADLAATQTALGAARGDITALSTTLGTTRTDLTTLGNELSATAITATEARDQADAVGRGLAATDARLTATGKDLAELVPRVGSVESAVQASDRKAQDAYSVASASSDAAQSAMENYAGLKRQLDAALSTQSGLIADPSFESPDAWQVYSGVQVKADSRAPSGQNVLYMPPGSGASVLAYTRQPANVVKGHKYRITLRLMVESAPAQDAIRVVYRDASTLTYKGLTAGPVLSSQELVVGQWALVQWDWEAPESTSLAFGVQVANHTAGKAVDDFQVVDITEQADLRLQIENAKQKAIEAAADAQSAAEKAGQAITASSGKATVTNKTTAPQGVGLAVGDIWFQWTSFPGGTVTGQWTWDGAAWRPVTLSHQVLSSVDLGKATVGELDGLRIKAGSVDAARMTIGVGANALADPFFTDVELRGRRAAASTGAWSYGADGGRPYMALTTAVTGTQTFRYAPLGTSGLIPTVAGRQWRIEVPMYLSSGRARVNVRWYNAQGAAFSYAAAGNYVSGPGEVRVVGEVTAPSDAVGFLIDLYLPSETTARTARVYGGASATVKSGSVHIEDGAVTASKVNAQEVAGAVGQFVKVQAQNVEVTGELAARVGSFMDARTRNLIVTGDATLTGKTYIENLAVGVVKSSRISTDQLTAGTASLDTATANKLFADIFAANRITAAQINVTETLSAEVARLMDIKAKNLIVTGNANLSGETFIKTLATAEIAAAKIGVGQLTAGNASLDTATANRMFVDIFAGNKIGAREIVVGGLPGDALADGAVGAVKIADGAVTAPKITATDEMTAKIMRAISTETAESFVRDRLVVGGAFEVLGDSIVNDLNVRGTLRGRDAILTGTVDVAQLNVTGDMAAEIGRFMRLETKKLIVTEAAVMQHVTAIEGIITPKITASEAKMGSLIAEKASIADIEGGNLTLTGNFRSGAVGKPGVIIPKNYTTYEGQEQLGVWLAPDGKAPSLGSEMGMTAGIWLDTASNKAGSTNSSPLNIRGQGGRGTRMWGDLQILPASNSRANIHSNTDLGVISTNGKLWGQGTAVYYVARDGDMEFQSFGKGGSTFEALGSGDMGIGSTTNTNLNASQDLNLRGFRDVLLKSGSSIKFFRPNNSPYINSWTAGGLKTVYMGGSSGTIYTDTSSRRFKVDIETAKPDHGWLDMRTVTYRDRIAVELKAEIEARRAAGDCTPLTAEEHERLATADRHIPGRIAEEGVGVADAQVVLDGSGQVESWDYSRDAVMLTPHVREHRDKIADLEARIAELESALL